MSLLPPGLAWRGAAALRTLRALPARGSVVTESLELASTAGYRLNARIVRPATGAGLPGLAISPAIHQGVTSLLAGNAVIYAAELAALGFVVVIHDPAGRGESWGEEDFGGLEHQDDLRVAIRAVAAHPSTNGRVGVLSLSLGLAAAAGALARWPELPVPWLVDWEGPCDREIITAGGTMLVPAAGHGLDDGGYWEPREATRQVGSMKAGYVRLQAFPDHAQPEELRHARRMLQAARSGSPAFAQLNDHPRGEAPARPAWLRGGAWAANRAILQKLAALQPCS